MYYFYTTDQAPNGTSDLIITDMDGTVIANVDEALFGYNVSNKPQWLALCDGESVFGTNKDIGDTEDIPEDMFVWQIDAEDALRFIAVSPVEDGTGTVDIINQYN